MFLSTKKVLTMLAILAGMGSARLVQAQDKTTWTLQECIDYAIKSNLNVQQAELDSRIAKINVDQSRSNLLPAVNGSSSYGFSFGRSIDPTENTFVNQQIQSNNFSLNLSVPLFNGFQLQNAIKRNRLDQQASVTDIERVRNEIILSVVSVYTQIIFSNELLQNARVQLGSTQQQADRTQKLFKAGSVAESNVFEINAQLATDELNIITYQNQKDIAELNLIQLMDLKNVKDFEVVKPDIKDPDQEVITFSPESVYEIAQQNLPQVKVAELRVSSALQSIELAKGAFYPRLSVGASVSTNYSNARKQQTLLNIPVTQTIGFVGGNTNQPVTYTQPFSLGVSDYPYFNQLTDNRGESIFLSLSVPIFNGFQVRNNVKRAIIGHQSAVLQTAAVRNQVRTSIQQAYADALASQKQFAATKRQLAALEQSFKNAEIRFTNGVLNPTDYNVAKNNYVRAQSDLIRAKYDYTFKLKVLDFYQNKPLSL